MLTILQSDQFQSYQIAIVGMSGRFPGARNIDEFWENLRNGTESISSFSDEQLAEAGVTQADYHDPQYVAARGILEGVDLFDAAFFNFSPREAEIMDPQHRLFLECAWEALENAGYDPNRYPGSIGVYAGTGLNTYLLFNLYSNQAAVHSAGGLQVLIGNEKDHLTTRVAYKLNLRGPCVTVQTACSTSLVAVHLACQSLLNGECDMVLAGGVNIAVPQNSGYVYEEGGILSPDGHCRVFDARARGSVSGNGVGVVVLKRLGDALEDGDCIHAVIRGSAANNDGSQKIGYTAPSVIGQRGVITEALTMAQIEARTVTYVEAHGTGTVLGDPVEIEALTQAFRAGDQAKNYCAVGSVKTNIGHLDAAAGVAGLIKVVMALKHKAIPPSLNFEQPNPQIDFSNSPFYVNNQLIEWKASHQHPRRACVSSFGVGGTNAHIVLEEAPIIEPQPTSDSWQVLVWSAKTAPALETATLNLAKHISLNPAVNLADVAYTLQMGRKVFDYRRMLVCRNSQDAIKCFEARDPQRILSAFQDVDRRTVAFMFSGLGDQYVNMGRNLYEGEPIFREHIDQCATLLKSYLDMNLLEVLYPEQGNRDREDTDGSLRSLDLRNMVRPLQERPDLAQRLGQTLLSHPAIFAIEYALAQLWLEWGVSPQALIGHSLGEYVAACVAGVFSVEEGLFLVAKRAQMIQHLSPGAMLAVPLSEEDIRPFLRRGLSLTAINGPLLCVISGSEDDIVALEQHLTEQKIVCRRLPASHAFHSAAMEPILAPFTELVKMINLKPPQIPLISNVTGTWATASEVTSPEYWTRHLRHTVRFADGIQTLLTDSQMALLEIGPGQGLCTLVRQQISKTDERPVLASLRNFYERQSDRAFILNALGQLWLTGLPIDWTRLQAHERHQRISLPAYPFERQHYWLEGNKQLHHDQPSSLPIQRKVDISDWFYIPSWKRSPLPDISNSPELKTITGSWLIFVDTQGLGEQIAQQLNAAGAVITVTTGQQFARLSNTSYSLNPHNPLDYDLLIKGLRKEGRIFNRIVHCWAIIQDPQLVGFYSLLFLTQALSKNNVLEPVQIEVVSNSLYEITGDEVICPECSIVLGLCKVIPQEYPYITCRNIDVFLAEPGIPQRDQLAKQIVTESIMEEIVPVVAYRGKHRWVQIFEAIPLKPTEDKPSLREGGTYLIVGGLGRIGLTLAEFIAQQVRAKLVLIGRSSFPAPEDWNQWITTHDELDTVSKKIRNLQALEALNAEVLVIRADIADHEQMQRAIDFVHKCYGEIHGVVHAAGVTDIDAMSLISETSPVDCERHFHAKIFGTKVLEQVLQGEALDFCLLISSLSSILGGLGFGAYASANLFLDAFAGRHNQTSPVPWISVDWDGEAFAQQPLDKAINVLKNKTDRVELSDVQTGLDAFQRIFLALHRSQQFVVSTKSLSARIEQWLQPRQENAVSSLAEKKDLALHQRPRLRNAYVAPRNTLEREIASLWQGSLGIEQIGVYDNFFELGGHSFAATRLVDQLRRSFQVDMSLRNFFESPTVADLAEAINNLKKTSTEPNLPSITPVARKQRLIQRSSEGILIHSELPDQSEDK
ncbi:phthiocerol/phenolphthiocerol synthesis type-I polyketide synthase E [Thermoflexales bacterium]|nr:phthiocerol/phenolphthiocerol synthesis type-I polyketide synthase E [Thermoflexales bacterium]